MTRVRNIVVITRVAVVSAFLVLACGETDQPSPPEHVADTVSAQIRAAAPAAGASDPTDPFFGFDLGQPVATTTIQRAFRLRLRNDGDEDVLVFADGGAGEVRIDSVTAGQWTEVELVTRAPLVVVRSATPAGRNLRRLEIDPVADTVREVVVHGPPAVP